MNTSPICRRGTGSEEHGAGRGNHCVRFPIPDYMPDIGEIAPDFAGVTQTGETLRLSDLRGRPVALYFYPRDETPGCTLQACSLRDGSEDLKEAGIAVVGVSPGRTGRESSESSSVGNGW